MRILDLRGVSCPTNFVKIKLVLEDLDGGEHLQVLLDDGEPVRNVPRSIKAEGHSLVSLSQADEGYYVLELVKCSD